MFELSQSRELEISGKIIKMKKHEEIEAKLSKLYDYIEGKIEGNQELLEAFKQYEDLNLLMLTFFNDRYYIEGFKDGVSVFRD
jgi:hypothetical protein